MEQSMTPSVMTDGQIDKAVETYRAMLRKHRSEFGSSAVQHALGQPEYVAEQVAVLRKYAEKAAIERTTVSVLKQPSARYPMLIETKLLRPAVKATVPARTKPFNAAAFYQTGAGLYVHDTFADRLDLYARQTMDSAPERPYMASLLKTYACDKDIRKELPENHLSTLEDIAGLIEAQSGGKQRGLLLNNSFANIFYVEGKNSVVFTVDVFWDSVGRQWHVNGRKLTGLWCAGLQVLYPGNVTPVMM